MSRLDRADEILLQAFIPTFTIVCDKITGTLLADADHLLGKCYITYLARGIRVFKCFAHLATQGYLDEAKMLARTLFEILVDLRYLKGSPSERSNKFWAYFDASVCRTIRKEQRIVGTGGPSPQPITDSERASIDAAEQAYLAQYPTANGKFPEHWSGLSIAKRAEEVGLLAAYLTRYHVQSDYVHTGPYGFASCMDFSDPTAFGINTGPDWSDSCVIIDGTCADMLECLMIVEDGMSLDCYDTIHKLYEFFAMHTGIPNTLDVPPAN